MREQSFHIGAKAIIINNGMILLLRKNSGLYWDFPGGRIQEGESVEKALKREVREETKLKIKGYTQFYSYIMPCVVVFNDLFHKHCLFSVQYLCEVHNPKKISLSSEHEEYQWFTPDQAAKMLDENHPEEFKEKLMKLANTLDAISGWEHTL